MYVLDLVDMGFFIKIFTHGGRIRRKRKDENMRNLIVRPRYLFSALKEVDNHSKSDICDLEYLRASGYSLFYRILFIRDLLRKNPSIFYSEISIILFWNFLFDLFSSLKTYFIHIQFTCRKNGIVDSRRLKELDLQK